MSSPMSNNLLNQNLLASGSVGEFANPRQGNAQSGSNSTMRTQRYQHEPASTSRRGRNSSSNGRGRFRKNSAKTNDESTNVGENQSSNTESSSNQPSENLSSSNTSAGRVIGYKASSRGGGGGGGGGGKSRQKQQGNQLLEGMSPMTGLDIEIAESILPSSSNKREVDAGKGRHLTNSRKVNLSHLLNCRFENKQRGNQRHHRQQSSSNYDGNFHRSSSHYRDPGTIHRFSKQQFLQANCQFVVLTGPDYYVHKVDPDWPVDWNFIEEVKFKQSASSENICPICLELPVAAKITRCGHIYCWTCMLQYLSLSDGSSRQCPICFEPVQKNELRSVISHSFPNHSVNEEIVMKLMVRKKGCVEVEPYKPGSLDAVQLDLAPSNSIHEDHYFSSDNLVIVDPATVISKIVQRERNELSFKLELDKDEPEVCFIEQALIELQKRVDKLEATATTEKPKVLVAQESLKEQNFELSKSYLFYQCSDGQHIYLNPFSTKILCQEFENLENCPLEIRANILQMDWISMSEAWRKRFRYLEHLPLTCEFRLIEIDFEHSNLISAETYSMFADQIRRREQEREHRRREERKREKIIQVEQNRRIYGIQPSLKINLNNIDQFPSVSDGRFISPKQRRQQRVDSNELLLLSSDNEEEAEEGASSVNHLPTTTPTPPPNDAEVTPDSWEEAPSVTNVALSFRDIQLQEAAKESSLAASTSKNSGSSVWANKKQTSSSSAQSSSFAQLLVDAKSSQKEWTRSNNLAKSTTAATSLAKTTGGSHKMNPANGSEDEDEELRAPPPDFTISDFIAVNLVSKKKGKGSKQK